MTFVAIGPTDLFLSAFGVQMDEHVKAWRWHWFRQGHIIERQRP